MNNPQKRLPFTEEELDEEQYTMSLLRLCMQHQLIDTPHFRAIQNGLNCAFIETAEQFTKRESSTLPRKQAEQLYASVLYQADIALMAYRSPARAVEALNTLGIETILIKGKRIILFLHEQNKKIYQAACQQGLSLPVYEYRYVMDQAFSAYCAGYSARFNARECCAQIDYPLLGRSAYRFKSKGVLFIHEYYTGILNENVFCRLFDEGQMKALLMAYGAQYRSDYKDLLFNISEVLLNNLMANALLAKPLFKLTVSPKDIRNLERRVCGYSEPRLREELLCALLPYQKQIQNDNCYAYLKKYIPLLSSELFRRLEKKNLKNFFVITDGQK